ncbi:Uncharacterised protein [Burkholderia pseudomallei]|nr:Uncharacterised protein [Burkholderia pseudomallei]CAJ2815163.1 Uncharacterised protein [Burkholderia pseudomallei]CAJ2818307.1 Uncharacterised protein [Burkholderia pseudomallei]CAJ2827948.1 Uncharacterised protein [Burkholderia pseudomallei]CAJ2898697.1 Uncharacterised protein [Burkholderia pseudomallei]
MHETRFVHLPSRLSPLTKALGVVAGITAISFAAAWAFEQHRQRELVRVLASMPDVISLFPTLCAHWEMAPRQFSADVPQKPSHRRP